MAPEDKTDPPTIRILLNEAEMEAERMTGWVRVVLALALAVSLLGSGGIASVAGYDEFWARLGLGALAVAAFLALGVASIASTGCEDPARRCVTPGSVVTGSPSLRRSGPLR